MISKHNHPLRVSAGLMTALSLGVASLAGCASFDPNPAATGQGTGQVATTSSQAATPAPSASQPPVAAKATTRLTGQVVIGGKPIAGARISVLNAFNDKAVAGIIAAGAGNLVAAGSGNLVAAGAGNYGLSQATPLSTDASGNFDLEMPQLRPGQVVRVVAETSQGPLLMLVGHDGAMVSDAKAYSVKQFDLGLTEGDADFVGGNISVPVGVGAGVGIGFAVEEPIERSLAIKTVPKFTMNFASTAATQLMSGVLKMTQNIAPEQRQKALDKVFEEAAQMASSLEKAAELNPEAEKVFLENLQEKAASGDATAAAALTLREVTAAMKEAGLDKALSAADIANAVADALEVYTETANADGTQVAGLAIELTQDDFPPELNIDLNSLSQGDFSYTDPTTGENVTVNIEVEQVTFTEDITFGPPPTDAPPTDAPPTDAPPTDAPPTDAPPTDAPPPADAPVDTNLPDFFTNQGKLAPTVSIEYESTDTTSPLKLIVSQNGSTSDVKNITAKIPVDYVAAINLAAAATINETAKTVVSGGWGTLAGTTNHTITKTGTPTSSYFSGEWRGSNGVMIADVFINNDGAFVTIKFDFAIASNPAVTTQGGSATLEALASIITLDTAAIQSLTAGSDNIVDISITSRDGSDTDTDPDDAALYGRPITIK